MTSMPGALTHGSRVKVACGGGRASGGTASPPMPGAWCRTGTAGDFAAQVWLPPTPYEFQNATPDTSGGLRIYEAHVGMAREEGRVGTFAEFTRDVLPRIAGLGYNAVQLMAVMEHPYYGSFGYHVSFVLRRLVALRDARRPEAA